jgi:hypothetical protein
LEFWNLVFLNGYFFYICWYCKIDEFALLDVQYFRFNIR